MSTAMNAVCEDVISDDTPGFLQKYSILHQVSHCMAFQFPEYIPAVRFHCILGNIQLIPYGLIQEPPDDQAQYFFLLVRQGAETGVMLPEKFMMI